MATELAQAYVQIIPSAQGIKGKLSNILNNEASNAGKSAGSLLGNGIGDALSGTTGKISAWTVAAGNLIADFAESAASKLADIGKSAISAGADLEQSIGGITTLLGNDGKTVEDYYQANIQGGMDAVAAMKSAQEEFNAFASVENKVFDNANKAFATAGVSANDYMQNITSLVPALNQVIDDTSVVADIADTAMQDMSDNANKMGTDLTSIQNAYQGFAKQNYTMLDNLKLGYGGTKEEMKRLLETAGEIDNVDYDISSLADIITAIHTIQEQTGITGTTLQEAQTTMSGSMSMLSASWQNLLANITLGNDVTEYISATFESAGYVMQNYGNAIKNVLTGIPTAISQAFSTIDIGAGIASKITSGITAIQEILPLWVSAGGQLASGIFSGIQLAWPTIMTSFTGLISTILQAITSHGAEIMTGGANIITSLMSGILQNIPQLIPKAVEAVGSLVNGFTQNLPRIVESGISMVSSLLTGLANALPSLIPMALQLIVCIVNTIISSLPQIVQMAANVVKTFATSFVNSLPQIITTTLKLVSSILQTLITNLPKFLQAGSNLLKEIVKGILSYQATMLMQIPKITGSIIEKFKSVDWASVGKNILQGIGNGIADAVTGLVDTAIKACGKLVDSVKSFFGIASPSRLMAKEVGRFIPEGMAMGIDNSLDSVKKSMARVNNAILNGTDFDSSINVSGNASYGSGFTQNITINSPKALSPSETARQTRNQTRRVILQLKGGTA